VRNRAGEPDAVLVRQPLLRHARVARPACSVSDGNWSRTRCEYSRGPQAVRSSCRRWESRARARAYSSAACATSLDAARDRRGGAELSLYSVVAQPARIRSSVRTARPTAAADPSPRLVALAHPERRKSEAVRALENLAAVRRTSAPAARVATCANRPLIACAGPEPASAGPQIPDFPAHGIGFQGHHAAWPTRWRLTASVRGAGRLARPWASTAVIAADARGFLLGRRCALELGAASSRRKPASCLRPRSAPELRSRVRANKLMCTPTHCPRRTRLVHDDLVATRRHGRPPVSSVEQRLRGRRLAAFSSSWPFRHGRELWRPHQTHP